MMKTASKKSKSPVINTNNVGTFLNYTLIIILILLILYTITYIYSIHKHTTETFENVYSAGGDSGKGFHVIYIYSDSCGYCKKFNPEFTAFNEKLNAAPLNVKSASKYVYDDPNVLRFGKSIKAFPTVLVVDDSGNVKESFVGYRSSGDLYNQVKKSVNV
jgi:thiol-disulfide isomerase/thioredoxin